MKQAQQMQENIKKVQVELADAEVGGEAGNDLVEVTMTCVHVVHKLKISGDLVKETADDKETLGGLVLATINDASKKAGETVNGTIGVFTQGLPAGMGDFFR